MPVIASAASGVISGGIGLFQRASANKWLKHNPMPIEGIPREVLENQGIANNMANTGLPSEQYARAQKQIERQQLIALKGAGDRRGGLASLAGLTTATNDAMGNLNAADAEARQRNAQILLGVNNNVAGIKRSLFDKNVREKYDRDYQQKMGELGSGNQNLTGGIDKLASAGIDGLFGGSGGRQGLTYGDQATYYDGYSEDQSVPLPNKSRRFKVRI